MKEKKMKLLNLHQNYHLIRKIILKILNRNNLINIINQKNIIIRIIIESKIMKYIIKYK
jgi:hypothetical protein